jgi:hypothetical protein
MTPFRNKNESKLMTVLERVEELIPEMSPGEKAQVLHPTCHQQLHNPTHSDQEG